MTLREAMDIADQKRRLIMIGISYDDADALRRISMTLRRWFEHECNGVIERDETTNRVYWRNVNHTYLDPHDPRATWRIADRETGARKRLATIMARYPELTAYVQGDPRGCSLYILTAEQIDGRTAVDAIYTRGVAVA